MASLLTHAVFAAALGQAAPENARKDRRFWCAAVVCSVLPDVDVIGFRFGVPYGALWGHRGVTHSLLFAVITGSIAGALLGRASRERWMLALLFFLVTASHGVLDAMTDGGLGVAFFSPFVVDRYFLPWRPIHVSPLGVHAAVSGRWISVLGSEFRSVWLFALLIGAFFGFVRSRRRLEDRIASGDSSR
jgi:inner membrane protein